MVEANTGTDKPEACQGDAKSPIRAPLGQQDHTDHLQQRVASATRSQSTDVQPLAIHGPDGKEIPPCNATSVVPPPKEAQVVAVKLDAPIKTELTTAQEVRDQLGLPDTASDAEVKRAQQIAAFIQANWLGPMLKYITPPDQLADRQKALEAEMPKAAQGDQPAREVQWGPVSKTAFADFVAQEKGEVSYIADQLKTWGLPAPKTLENGKDISADILSGQYLPAETTLSDAQKLANVVKFLADARKAVKSAESAAEYVQDNWLLPTVKQFTPKLEPQPAEKPKPTVEAKPDSPDNVNRTIADYTKLLTAGLTHDETGQQTAQQITQLADKLKAALAPDATQKMRDDLKMELLKTIRDNGPPLMPTGSNLKLATGEIQTGAQTIKLQPGDASNPDLVAASELFLTYFNHQTDRQTTLSATIDDPLRNPSSGKVVYTKDKGWVPVAEQPKPTLSASQDDLAKDLKHWLTWLGGSSGIAVGDMLAKLGETNGGITPNQFASIVQTSLKNPDAAQNKDTAMDLADMAGVTKQVTAPPEPTSQQAAEKAEAARLDQIQARLQSEMAVPEGDNLPVKDAQWGPASQDAYKNLLDSLQGPELRRVVAELASWQLHLPDHNPFPLVDGNGKKVTEQEYMSAIISGEIKPSLGLDPTKPPTVADVQQVYHLMQFMKSAEKSITEAQQAHADDLLTKRLDDLHAPPGWYYKDGDKAAWRLAAAEMIELVTRVHRHLDVIDKLHLDKDPRYRIGLPEGTDPPTTENGKTLFTLKVPDDLRLNDPVNAARIKALETWDAAALPRITQVVSAIQQAALDPLKVISFGDVPQPSGTYGVFDKTGTLVRTGTLDDITLGPRETMQSIDMLRKRTDINDSGTGDQRRIKVTQNVQAESVPWYSYHDLTSVTDVGQPLKATIGRNGTDEDFRVGDIAAVQIGGKLEPIMAEDLDSTNKTQEAWYWAQKGLDVGMDGLMLATGGVQFAAARGALLLAEEAGAYAGRRVATNIAKGLFDTTLGATGFIDNASNPKLSTIRGLAFMATMTPPPVSLVKDLAKGGARLVGLGATGDDSVALTRAAARDRMFQEEIQKSGATAAKIAQWSQWAGIGLQVPMAGMIGGGLKQSIADWWNPSNPYAMTKGVTEFGAGNGRPKELDAPAVPKTPEVKADSPTDVALRVAGYKDLLTSNLPDTDTGHQTKEKVAQIFDAMQKVLGPDATPEMRENFKRDLMANIGFNPTDLWLLSTNDPKLTSQQIRDLWDPTTRDNYQNQDLFARPMMIRQANLSLSRKDPDIVAASEIVLLYLNHQTEPQTAEVGRETNGRMTFSLDRQDIIADLSRRLAAVDNRSAGIAIGDVLLKVGQESGGISPSQFGSILQRVLKNPDSTAADKMHALADVAGPRMATAVVSQYMQEARITLDPKLTPDDRKLLAAQTFGTTSKDLEATLETTATNDKDEDVRAMSASLLYGLRLFKSNPDDGAKFLDGLEGLRESTVKNGTFAQEAQKLLIGQLASSKPEGVQQRLDLIASLRSLATNASNQDAITIKSQIGQSLGESIKVASASDVVRLMQALQSDTFELSAVNDRALADDVRNKVIQCLQSYPKAGANYDYAVDQQMAQLASSLPMLFKNADATMQGKLDQLVGQMLERSSPQFTDFRVDLIHSVGDLDRNIVHLPIPKLEKLAGSDGEGSIRKAALLSLEKLRDPQLPTLLAKLAESETQAEVQNTIADIQFRVGGGVKAPDFYVQALKGLQSFQSDLDSRYPALTQFDAKAQRAWLEQAGFPLLVNDDFVNQYSSFGYTPDQSYMRSLVAKQQNQFQALVTLANGDVLNGDPTHNTAAEDVQKARQLLLSIAMYKGPSQSSGLGPQAARALAQIATTTNTGGDLSARLVSWALAHGDPDPLFLKAWDEIGKQHRVPEAVYQYVAHLADPVKLYQTGATISNAP
jgi:hypothetical protein